MQYVVVRVDAWCDLEIDKVFGPFATYDAAIALARQCNRKEEQDVEGCCPGDPQFWYIVRPVEAWVP